MKNIIYLPIAIVLLFFPACSEEENTIETSTDFINAITGESIGTSKIIRQENGIVVDVDVSNLSPDYAYTLWLVIWNNPENCGIPGECADVDFAIADQVEVQVVYGTGNVIEASRQGRFTTFLAEGDSSGSIHELFGLPNYGGLKDAMTAEIHPVLRSHGPSIPGEVGAQINSYEGGCSDNFAPFTEIPDEIGECGDIAFALHRSPNI